MTKPVPSIKSQFDYSGLDEQVRSRLKAEEAAICEDLMQIKTSAVTLGNRLIEIKALIPKRFGAWVRARADFTERAAELFMSAARFAAEHKVVAERVNQTALYALAAPRLDEAVRRRVIKAIESGKVNSSSEIRGLIRQEKRAADSPMANGGGDQVDDGVQAAVQELAAILTGSLPETDLERVRAILVSIATTRFLHLAAELATNLPAAKFEPPGQDS